MHSVKLSDGAVIDNLELNGNNYILNDIIDKNIFVDNLKKVAITDVEGNVEELNNAKVIFAKVGDKDSFILAEKTNEELEKEQLNQLLADLIETVLLSQGGM